MEKIINGIKERLNLCGGNYEFNELTLDMSDGNEMECVCAFIRDGELFIKLKTPYTEFEIGESEIEKSVKYQNAIFNAIRPPKENEEIVRDLTCMVGCQPNQSYCFTEPLIIELEDGNKFDCNRIWLFNRNIYVRVYSTYTDEFEIDVDDISVKSLEEIRDSIIAPIEIIVWFKTPLESFAMFCKEVHAYTSKEDLLKFLEENFPAFKWEWNEKEEGYECQCEHNYKMVACLSEF